MQMEAELQQCQNIGAYVDEKPAKLGRGRKNGFKDFLWT